MKKNNEILLLAIAVYCNLFFYAIQKTYAEDLAPDALKISSEVITINKDVYRDIATESETADMKSINSMNTEPGTDGIVKATPPDAEFWKTTTHEGNEVLEKN